MAQDFLSAAFRSCSGTALRRNAVISVGSVRSSSFGRLARSNSGSAAFSDAGSAWGGGLACSCFASCLRCDQRDRKPFSSWLSSRSLIGGAFVRRLVLRSLRAYGPCWCERACDYGCLYSHVLVR